MAKHEPDLDLAVPPARPPPSAPSHRVKPEPSSGHAIPPPKAEPKLENDDVKPDVRPRAHKRERASRSASPLAGAPDGWVEDPDEVARRAAQREGERERREERKAMGIKPRKRAKRSIKDEDDVKVKKEPSLYNRTYNLVSIRGVHSLLLGPKVHSVSFRSGAGPAGIELPELIGSVALFILTVYMKEKMALPQTDDPPLLHKERFKRVAESWKFSLKNPNVRLEPSAAICRLAPAL